MCTSKYRDIFATKPSFFPNSFTWNHSSFNHGNLVSDSKLRRIQSHWFCSTVQCFDRDCLCRCCCLFACIFKTVNNFLNPPNHKNTPKKHILASSVFSCEFVRLSFQSRSFIIHTRSASTAHNIRYSCFVLSFSQSLHRNSCGNLILSLSSSSIEFICNR